MQKSLDKLQATRVTQILIILLLYFKIAIDKVDKASLYIKV